MSIGAGPTVAGGLWATADGNGDGSCDCGCSTPPGQPTPPPPGGPNPPPPPGSGSQYHQLVAVNSTKGFVAYIPVTCVESGVTMSIECDFISVFYHDTTGMKDYSTPGGGGRSCSLGTGVTAGSGSASGPVPTQGSVTINVTVS